MNAQTANDFIKYIATLLNVPNLEAQLVFKELRDSGFNFSVATQEKFDRAAKVALKVVRIAA